MRPDIYWVGGLDSLRLGLMARPRSGDWLEDEIAGWRRADVGTVVSLLEAHEVRELDLTREAMLCAEQKIEFISFPIQDRGTPRSGSALSELVEELVVRLKAGAGVAIHCRAGIGRTGLIAACVLCRLGVPYADIFETLSRSRGVAMPDTQGQIDWVKAFSSANAAAGKA